MRGVGNSEFKVVSPFPSEAANSYGFSRNWMCVSCQVLPGAACRLPLRRASPWISHPRYFWAVLRLSLAAFSDPVMRVRVRCFSMSLSPARYSPLQHHRPSGHLSWMRGKWRIDINIGACWKRKVPVVRGTQGPLKQLVFKNA